jgi:hypothetical protein
MWEIVSLTGGFAMLILGAGYLVDNASALDLFYFVYIIF